MQPGALARQGGLTVDTWRFYEKIRLIRPPARLHPTRPGGGIVMRTCWSGWRFWRN